MNFQRFYIDGVRVKSDNISNLTEVDTFFQQIGGSGDEPPAGETPITLKVRDQAGEVMFFKVKKNTEMKKIFEAYAQRLGVAANQLRFTLDGERIKETDTPKMLELGDEDQIDVLLNQVGGSSEDVKPDDAPITLTLREGQGGETIAFKVKKSTKMSKIFEAYASRKGVASTQFRFMFDGSRVHADSTPKMMEMEDDDIIEVMLDQQGGV